ncbi:hypothetical protein K504DRAFT_497128 [Pleomassaria siparia CBS 279.74]|uniref:Uncharacterized protein n=1 Tax=Pleomassaria siparia CBS 279.74 TaxID=1314801 RepID=A0A6G1KRL0_9PLEO|nr:hypothetical protein K504DRAFT_497128 [Pleomassaria siparia CBS 279.74]
MGMGSNTGTGIGTGIGTGTGTELNWRQRTRRGPRSRFALGDHPNASLPGDIDTVPQDMNQLSPIHIQHANTSVSEPLAPTAFTSEPSCLSHIDIAGCPSRGGDVEIKWLNTVTPNARPLPASISCIPTY